MSGKKRALLFDGDDDDSGGGGGGSGKASASVPERGGGLLDADDAGGDGGGGGAVLLGFNPEFARRFEHNKRREELHRLKEKNPRLAAKLERDAARELAGKEAGDDDDDDGSGSSSSDDDDDLEELAARDDTDRVLAVLTALKKKDPSIKQPDVRFFDDDDDDGEGDKEEQEAEDERGAAGGDDNGGGQKKKKKKDKPVYLRQVIAQQALDKMGVGGDTDDDDDDEEAAAGGRGKNKDPGGGGGHIPLYNQEQAELKRDFLRAADEAAAAAGGGDEGGFGIVRAGKHGGAASSAAQDKDKDKRVQKMLEEYFGADDNLDPDERFLKSYLAKKEWLKEDGDDDDSSSGGGEDEDEDEDASADKEAGAEKKDKKQKKPDAYADVEADEAFLEQADKFEANYNFRYEAPGAAQIVGHPRIIEDVVRKKDDKRARKRKDKAERQAAEEAARREEVKRLKNLKKAEIQDKLLAVQQVAGVAAPDANLVDALLEGDFDPDEYDRRMAAAFGADYYDKAEEEGGDVVEDAQAARLLRDAGAVGSDDEAEDEVPIGAKSTIDRSTGRKGGAAKAAPPVDEAAAAEARAQVSQLMEQYYSLDYEGTAGGMKTRFKYRQVEPSTLGLTIEEILRLPDKSLNQIASLKLLAPYRDGPKPRPNYKALQAVREEQMAGGKRRRPSGGNAGLRVEVESLEPKPWHDKWKRPPQEHMDKGAARAASFAPLSLNKPQSQSQSQRGAPPPKKAKKDMSAGGPGRGEGGTAGAGGERAAALTKAQKKNLKRASKRAAERQKA